MMWRARKKDSLSGQMSLFDFVDETTKRSYETVYPDVGEYEKSDLLALEKEVLGIYVSGHPLEEQEECWRKNISAVTTDFQPDEETGFPSVTDGAKEIVGGIITDKKSNIQRITRQWHFSHSRTSSAVWKSSYSRAITRKTQR